MYFLPKKSTKFQLNYGELLSFSSLYPQGKKQKVGLWRLINQVTLWRTVWHEIFVSVLFCGLLLFGYCRIKFWDLERETDISCILGTGSFILLFVKRSSTEG